MVTATHKVQGAGGNLSPAFELITSTVTGSAGSSVTLSVAPQANDIILVYHGAYGTTPTSNWISIPPDCTRITRVTKNWDALYAGQSDIGYKKATGSEGTIISGWGTGGNDYTVRFVAVYRAKDPYTTITPRDVTAGSTQNYSTTIDANLSPLRTISFLGQTATSTDSTSSVNREMDIDYDGNYGPMHWRIAALAQEPTALSVTWTNTYTVVFTGASTYLELS